MASPILISGLGNPGDKYKDTRHNLGFRVIDTLVDRWGTPTSVEAKFRSELYTYFSVPGVCDQKVLLQKPLTYMNLSGQAVREAVTFFKVSIDTSFLAIYDEVDLPPGKIRVRKSGGAGGHNGVKSLIADLGTQSFNRIRIGVGRNPNRPTDVHVLGKIPKSEQALYEETLLTCAQAVEVFIREGVAATMNQFNEG